MRSHGRLSTYNTGCRCDECRQAKAAHQRRLRGPGTGVGLIRGAVAPEMLWSRCWCDSVNVEVSARDVLNGRTVSCGAVGCDRETMMKGRAG